MKRESFILSLLSSAVFLPAVWTLNNCFQKTGYIESSNLDTVSLHIHDFFRYCKSTGDPKKLVPVTILPIDDDEIELEWNPKELIQLQAEHTYDSNPLWHSFYANIYKHVLSGLDERKVGIIIKVPKDRLVEIEIGGGYQANILKGFTKDVEKIYLTQLSTEFENRTQYSSPKVNADFTSLPEGSSIRVVSVYNSHLVLKTSGSVGLLTAGSEFKVPIPATGYYLETYELQGSPTTVEIQGNIGGPLDPFRSGCVYGYSCDREISLAGPNTTAIVDGDINVTSVFMESADLIVSGEIIFSKVFQSDNDRLGTNTVHAGGIEKNSEIRIMSQNDVTDFIIMVPNCGNIEFDYPFAYNTDNRPAECLQMAGPQVSVNFLDLTSPNFRKTRWDIIAPIIAVCAIILILCGIFTYHRVKTRLNRNSDSSRKVGSIERAELGVCEPQ